MDFRSRQHEGNDLTLRDALVGLAGELAPLVAESGRAQGELSRFRKRYERLRSDAPLPPRAIDEMRKGTRRYLDLQQELGLLVRRTERLEAGAAGSGLAARGVATALAAAVMLYDNYLAMLPLLGDRRFRRLVNHVDLGYGIRKNELWEVVERLNDQHSRRQLARLIATWEAHADGTGAAQETPSGPGVEAPPGASPHAASGAASPGSVEPSLRVLNETIESSATYFLAHSGTLDRHLPTAVRFRRERILDGLAQLGSDVLYFLSEGFGNAIGQVELRKGKLWEREDVLGHLHQVLRPLDLLLEKTPFRLTDLLIPGHFGHVAIWMGRPRKLKRTGVWKHPDMQEKRWQDCRPLVEEGRGVLEALRSGVELNALRVFANVDDLAIIRPMRLGRKQVLESLVRGFHQYGKEYDFAFDVETTDTIVCSELPYHVFTDVDWQTEAQMGRFTITPDDVAHEAIGPKPDFGLVAFYHDGALVPAQDAKRTLRDLLA